jgi:23S rRNA (cytidine1920-2'-O)/16S rRNA (cytidine1409-2'-O)-methyltransferase
VTRLDQELLRRGLARSRTHAATLISQSLVSSDGRTLTKASQQVAPEQDLTVADDGGPTYVSRAGHKLAGALDAFPSISVASRRCLDAGASTGGFTDVLLRRGAARVIAVDVGHGQLVPELRDDPRVQVHEGLNLRYLSPDDIGGPVELTVCDLSFISLTLVMQPLAAATMPGGNLLLMVKPQFEVGRERLSRTGVVAADHERRRAVHQVAEAADRAGLLLRGLAESPLPGQDGNHEYFLWLERCAQTDSGLTGPARIEERQAAVREWVDASWPTASAGPPAEPSGSS